MVECIMVGRVDLRQPQSFNDLVEQDERSVRMSVVVLGVCGRLEEREYHCCFGES